MPRRKRRRAQSKTGTGQTVDDVSPPLPAVIEARSAAEAALVAAHETATQDHTQRAPRMRKIDADGGLGPDTDDVALWRARLAQAFGVSDVDAQMHLIFQTASVFWQGSADGNVNAAI